jgi:membrane-associated phospholipid phosphatase
MTIKQKKLLMLFANVPVHVFGYLALNTYLGLRGLNHNVAIAWDYRMPYIKYFAPFYSLVYFMPLITFSVIWRDYEIFKGAFKAFFFAGLLCLIIFFIFPVEFTLRATLVPPYDLFDNLVRFFYWVDDPPYNCIPSLHVGIAFISARAIHLSRRSWAPWFYLLATMIMLSTLFIRQHFVLDVVAGMLVSVLMSALFLPRKLGLKSLPREAVLEL